MKIQIATVDAFASKAFSGNPAAVCLLENPLSKSEMQSIAMEMNLSETAFVKRTETPGVFGLRWFTPTLEIDLCGHATLASAFWMFESGWAQPDHSIRFETLSGELIVKKTGDQLEMDFPLIPTFEEIHPFFKESFMGKRIFRSAQLRKNWIFELASADEVENLKPDFDLIAKNSEEGIIVTATGKDSFDIYSRFFGPNVGVPEDPVTGFAHCALMDYWSRHTGKFQLKAYQASKRGGELHLEKHDDRVILKGNAVKVLSGSLEF
ncbi:PhzF family phenazine biosynthesis protein [Algoriphagus marinus]|uniref:PhzF family phenazine biosynthesis protein n=1 Tax=Algoriphagus marinus TaxID=1925762 RepID=UPI00094B90DF|nr:PhzF family phenazine biosynthesis protein [Algoriphagus marinus]